MADLTAQIIKLNATLERLEREIHGIREDSAQQVAELSKQIELKVFTAPPAENEEDAPATDKKRKKD